MVKEWLDRPALHKNIKEELLFFSPLSFNNPAAIYQGHRVITSNSQSILMLCRGVLSVVQAERTSRWESFKAPVHYLEIIWPGSPERYTENNELAFNLERQFLEALTERANQTKNGMPITLVTAGKHLEITLCAMPSLFHFSTGPVRWRMRIDKVDNPFQSPTKQKPQRVGAKNHEKANIPRNTKS